MESERTVWAEGLNLSPATIEELTEVTEEASRRGFEGFLDPRDISEWPLELDRAGLPDLAERVREIDVERA